MKVVVVGPASVIHLLRWANGIAERGNRVSVITLHEPLAGYDQRIEIVRIGPAAPIGYALAAGALRRELRTRRPDVVHVHFASGYGLLASLGGQHPMIISVWGSDVYDFPSRSPAHKALLKRNLAVAARITSASHAMAERTRAFTDRPIAIVPFGVDVRAFRPANPASEPPTMTIGTVKTMAPRYGIDTLLRAAARLRSNSPVPRFLLRIVGGGPDLNMLQRLACSLGLSSITTFVGAVDHARVPSELHRLTIAVFPSREESFGCAALEAMACGIPVVASDAPGFREVLNGGDYGIIVRRDDPDSLADALRALIMSPERRRELADRGRAMVADCYEWSKCLDRMLANYQAIATPRLG